MWTMRCPYKIMLLINHVYNTVLHRESSCMSIIIFYQLNASFPILSQMHLIYSDSF